MGLKKICDMSSTRSKCDVVVDIEKFKNTNELPGF